MKRRTFSTSIVLLPDGTYTGILSGYEVAVTVRAEQLNPVLSMGKTHKVEKTFSVLDGIRGTVECEVHVTFNTAIILY